MSSPRAARIGPPIERLGENAGEAARCGDCELAARCTGAARDVGERVRAAAREAEARELAMECGQLRVGDEAQHEVLLVRRAQLALAELHDERAEAAQLRGGDVAEHEADHDGGEARLLLRSHAVGGPGGVARIRLADLLERHAALR